MLWSYHQRVAEIEQHLGESMRRIGELIQVPGFARLRQILEPIPGIGLVTSATAVAVPLTLLAWTGALVRKDELHNPGGPLEPVAACRLSADGTSKQSTGFGRSPGFMGHGLTGQISRV